MPSLSSQGSYEALQHNWVKLDLGNCLEQMPDTPSVRNSPQHHADFVDPKANIYSTGQCPRISKPFELMRNSYEVVVIGSGYGGSVAASRMARARQSVCVLERGQERWPGEYPVSQKDFVRQLRVSHYSRSEAPKGNWPERGNSSNLFQLAMGEGQAAISGCGLGGTSLLNANVFLEADDATLKMDSWPVELRKEELKPYYARAASMLEPERYPSHFPELPKLEVFKRQAQYLGLEDRFSRVPQTTRFADGINGSGVGMQASTLSGMDTTGLNDGSKSSTLVNYLSDAWNWGAEMFTGCDVSHVEPHPSQEGYLVFFKWRGFNAKALEIPSTQSLLWVHATKGVFLGAGSLGTSEILLRSKQMGLSMSDKVGSGISGNGDILSFGYDADENIHSVACEYPSPESPIGPTITGMIDCRNKLRPEDGFVIQEGVIPAAFSTTLQPALEAWKDANLPEPSFSRRIQRTVGRLGSLIFGPRFQSGSMEKTQVYLVMSHSVAISKLTLQHDRPVLKLCDDQDAEKKFKINSLLREATKSIGGTFVEKPANLLLEQPNVSVHCMGGACISKTGRGEHGATNHLGEVLKGNGDEVHEGLIVCDGALMPGALGVNPLATITALAELSVESFATKIGAEIDYDTRNGVLDLWGKPEYPGHFEDEDLHGVSTAIEDADLEGASGFRFTEVMSGDIFMKSDPIKDQRRNAQLLLTVSIFDMNNLVNHPSHSAVMTGSFTCDGLQSPMIIYRGRFHLFTSHSEHPDSKKLEYRCKMMAKDGEEYQLVGFKFIDNSSCFAVTALWKAMTTLHVRIQRKDKSVVGRGILKIQQHDFQRQLKTMQATGKTWLTRGTSYARFMLYFSRNLAHVFFAPFNSLQWPLSDYRGFINITMPSRTYRITAVDDVQTTLHMWEPLPADENNPVPDVLCISGSSLDHQVFATPTIEVNAVTFFRKAGYRVYSLNHRIGRTVTALKGYTAFDARLDIYAALSRIRELQVTNSAAESVHRKIYIVAYCAGSLATACGILDGTIPTSWIAGLTASNVFMTPRFATVNSLKSNSPIALPRLYKFLAGSFYNCTSHLKESRGFQYLLNQALRFYPVATRSDICNSVVCHRSSFVFGGVFSHKNINEATHRQFHRFIGGVSITALEHLVEMGKRGHVTGNAPEYENLITAANLQRLKGIPIFLFSGADNALFAPKNTKKSYELLCETFEDGNYEYTMFQGKGHLDCWIGREAYLDVYPRVRQHIDMIMKGLYQTGQ